MTVFETFLQQLAPVLELPSLIPDAHGVCYILMKKEQVSLLFECDDHLVPGTILVSSAIGKIPAQGYETLLKAILQENHNLEETLSCKPDEEILYVHRRLHPDIPAEEMREVLTSFIACISLGQEKLKSCLTPPPEEKTSFLNIFPKV